MIWTPFIRTLFEVFLEFTIFALVNIAKVTTPINLSLNSQPPME